MKEKFITAFMYLFGGTKQNAEKVYKTATPDYINTVISGYQNNCKKAFYED